MPADRRDEDRVTPLMHAAQNGHFDVVKMLIDAGAKIDAANKDGWTALMIAAQYGHFEIAMMLIDAGATVDAANNNGATALMIAAYSGHFEVVRMLIGAGAKFDAANKNGWTALTSAAETGRFDVVKMLIDAGATVDAANKDGWTALMIAVQYGHFDVAEMLIDAGATVDDANTDGLTALMIAAREGHFEIAKVLIDAGAKVDAVENTGYTALMTAAQYGQFEIAKMLIDANASLEIIPVGGDTALLCAAFGGQASNICLLLEAGADPTVVNNNGKTAQAIASENGRTEAVQALDDATSSPQLFFRYIMGGNVDNVRKLIDRHLHIRDPQGRTPVLVAAQHDQVEVLKLLVFRGANLADRDESGRTALHYAAQRGNIGTVRFLLAQHTAIDAVDERGLRPIDVAAKYGYADLVRELHARGSRLNYTSVDGRLLLHHAICAAGTEVAEVVTYLLAQDGVVVDAVDGCGWSALHLAIDKGNAPIVETLLLQGADVSLLTKLDSESSRQTRLEAPLHFAVKSEHHDIVRLLLAQPGVNVDVRNHVQQTPLFVAVNLQNRDIAQMLIDANANPDSHDEAGETPLLIASRVRSDDLVKLLLEHGARVDVTNKSGESPLSVASTDNIRSVLQLYHSSQQFHDRCLALLHKSDGPTPAKELEDLIPLITSVYDLRLLLTLAFSMIDGEVDQRSSQATALFKNAFDHVLANKLVLDDDACVFFHLVLEHCANAKLLSSSEFMRWKVLVTKVNMESAEWVVELKKQVHHNSYRLGLHDQNVRLMVRGMREMHVMVTKNRDIIGAIATRVEALHGQVGAGKKLLNNLVSHAQILSRRVDHFKRRIEQGEAGVVAVATSVNSLHGRVDAGQKLLTRLVPYVHNLFGQVDRLQHRLQHNESNIVAIASNVTSFRNAYAGRLEQERKQKILKMSCGVLASVVGFMFAPVLKDVFDSVIDLTNPVDIFDHAFSEGDIVGFLANQSEEYELKPLVQQQLENLAIPVGEFETVLRQEIALRCPELVAKSRERGFEVQLEYGDSSAAHALVPKLDKEEVQLAQTLRELNAAVMATEFNTVAFDDSGGALPTLDIEEAQLSEALRVLELTANELCSEEKSDQSEDPMMIAPSYQVPRRNSRDAEPLPKIKIRPGRVEDKDPTHIEMQTTTPSNQDEETTVEFADDIHAFSYHYAVQASGGDLDAFLDLTDVIGNNEDDPDAVMALRLVQRSTSRVSICAAEYAYLLGYCEVGDMLAARMDDRSSLHIMSPSQTVELLEDAAEFAYVFAVQASQGDVGECELLLEVMDNEVDKIDVRIEAEVIHKRGSKSVAWSAVEYACHLGYVAIVKHLLVEKHVKTTVRNVVMLQRARQRAKALGLAM